MSAPKDSVAASPGHDVVASPGLDIASMSGDAEAGGEKATQTAPEIVDLYRPLPVAADAPEEGNPLTVRAVIVGIILGSLVNASNIYLGAYPWTPTGLEIGGFVVLYSRASRGSDSV